MKFFHFTSIENYNAMLLGKRMGHKALVPIKPLVTSRDQRRQDLPYQVADPVIFGFLSKFHSPWYRKLYADDVPYLEKVLNDIKTNENYGICLLQVEVLPTDLAYVIEKVACVRPDYVSSELCTDDVTREVLNSFWASRIPLSCYLGNNTSYIMPEVIVNNPIPVERLYLIDMYKKHDLINHVRLLAGRKLYALEAPSVENWVAEEPSPSVPTKATSPVTYLTLIK